MKIALASDIHLEFGDLFLKNEENAEVLILAATSAQLKFLNTNQKKEQWFLISSSVALSSFLMLCMLWVTMSIMILILLKHMIH